MNPTSRKYTEMVAPQADEARLKTLPKRKADFIEPMDCAPVSRLPDGSNWLFEIKLDGYRAIGVKADGRVNLYSRRRKSFDHHYPLIVEALAELPDGTVVDGEVVALDESGRPHGFEPIELVLTKPFVPVCLYQEPSHLFWAAADCPLPELQLRS